MFFRFDFYLLKLDTLVRLKEKSFAISIICLATASTTSCLHFKKTTGQQFYMPLKPGMQ